MSTFQTLNPQLSYFCHQCDGIVSLSPNPNSDLSCPVCHGDFLEELDNPNPNPIPSFPDSLFSSSPFGPSSFFSDPFFTSTTPSVTRRASFIITPSSILSSSSDGGAGGIGRAGIAGSGISGGGIGGAGGFNPVSYLDSIFSNFQANGLNIQFEVESSDGSSSFPANLGDYITGPGLEQFLQHLMENDPNRHGPPPASETAVEGLPSVVVGEEVVNSESNSCAVCMTEFELNGEVKQMPCKHLFHSECILPWLKLHNSCPVCRFELPTDDQDYETRKTDGGDGSGTGRTLNIQLPWPSASYRGNNDGNGSGGGETSLETLD